MTWIDHYERCPEHEQKVIYFFKYVGVHRGTYYADHDCYCEANGFGFLCGDVTHWMPDEGQELPNAPEGYVRSPEGGYTRPA